MNENKNNQNEDLELLEEMNASQEEVVDEELSREEQIEFRISEINVIVDEYQNKLYDENIEIMTTEEYDLLLEEQKNLKKELKELRKETHNSFWDKVKVWHLIYGLIQLFICMPLIGGIYHLCMLVYSKLYEWFGDKLINVDPEFAYFIEVVMMLAFPIINIFITWIIYANCVSKKRLDQIVFLSIFAGQILLTIISMLFVFVG